jgi:Ran GTPase-activating protein (RanGAP) involved in mRNA processing and transport/RNA recognition motif-containing protein
MEKDDSDLPMSTTQLYCGNLPFSLSTEGLSALFNKYGALTDSFVAHRSNKPRGFGFVTFKDPAAAKKAQKEINGRVVEGSKLTNGQKEKREIRVTFARERPEGDRHHAGERKSGGNGKRQGKKQEKSRRKKKGGKDSSNDSAAAVASDTKNTTSTATTKTTQKSSASSKTAPVSKTISTTSKTAWGDIVKGKSKATTQPTTTETKKAPSPTRQQQQSKQQQHQPKPKPKQQPQEFVELEIALKAFAEKRWNSSDLYLRKALTKSSSSSSSGSSLRSQIPKISSYIRAKKSLRRVNLSNNALDDADLKIFCAGLAESSVTVLDLSYNDISAEGAKYLASVLRKKNCALVELNLGFNRLCGEGIQHLAKALEINTSLRTLHVERNYLDNQGSKAIGTILSQNKSLERLNVSRALFDESYGYDQIANGLRSNTTLKSLRLQRCKLGPDGARAIAAALKTNEKSAIMDIDVHFNKIGVLGAQEIGLMLASNTKIEKLNLQYNNIGVEGARHIAKGLETNKTLIALDISYNTIKDDGAKLFYKLIQNVGVLKNVKLEENFITPEGKQRLRSLASDNRKVSV